MPKKIAITSISVIFFCGFLSAQHYISYYQGLVGIEKAVMEDDYEKALFKFDSLFRRYDFIFAVDYFTAAQVAVKLERYDRAFDFLKKAVKRGITLKVVQDNGLLARLQQQEGWEDFEANYDNLRSDYLRTIDTTLCETVYHMYAQGEDIAAELDNSSQFKAATVSSKWKKMARKNGEALIEIIAEYGFPGERLIGLDECEGPPSDKREHIVGKNVLLTAKMATVMLLHYFQEPQNDINELLMTEVMNGNLPPSQYAIVQDYLAEFNYKAKGKYDYYHQFTGKVKRGDLEEVNARREEIGLGPIKHRVNKRKRWHQARANKLLDETVYLRL